MNAQRITVASDEHRFLELAAERILQKAEEALGERKHFDFVLVGGTTPRAVYQYLAEEKADSIDWMRVRFFWGDERYVPIRSSESNFKMVNDTLLRPLGIREHQIFRFKTELSSPEEVARDYERTLRQLFTLPRFDLVLLGLGEDGHTASLFPDAWPEWAEAQKQGRWVAAPWVPHLSSRRLTLLPPVLSSADSMLFLVTGAKKASILSEVLNEGFTLHPSYPAQLFLPKAHWLVDTAAAQKLSQAA